MIRKEIDKQMRKTLKSNNGVTLVALVITIGVLLILAVVTITQVLDDEGIVNKSSEFAENTTESMNQTGEDLVNALSGLDDIMNPWKQNKTEKKSRWHRPTAFLDTGRR